MGKIARSEFDCPILDYEQWPHESATISEEAYLLIDIVHADRNGVAERTAATKVSHLF
jgi:hypothetical protein